jgi:hypothetical protein
MKQQLKMISVAALSVVFAGSVIAEEMVKLELELPKPLFAGTPKIQIDLGDSKTIYAVALWHYHAQARAYRDVIIQIADDADFIENVQTVFNNDHDNSAGLGIGKDKEYIETNKGKLVDAKGAKGQYVRLYSNGSTGSDMNHYIEVEVFGK